MKNRLLFLLLACLPFLMMGQGVPELMYYRFDGTGTTVPNLASTPVGTSPAPIVGTLTQGGTGQFGSGLQGTGGTASANYLNTGWAPNLGNGPWTMAFYISNVPQNSTLHYILGDGGTSSWRCFDNGVAGAGNWMMRGPITDVTITGGSGLAPHVMHFVYDPVAGVIRGYLDGVLNTTVAQGTLNITGTGPFRVGGYTSGTGLDGIMDEFRLYNRALTPAEITATWNNPLPLIVGPHNAAMQQLLQPVFPFCAGGPQTFEVSYANFGNDTLTSVNIDWTINGVAQTGLALTGLNLLPAERDTVILGTATFLPGVSYDVDIWTSSPSGMPDQNTSNDTISFVGLKTGLPAGTYTINSAVATGGTNYQSFTDAVSDLNAFGICGPVLFNVVAGTYNESINIGSVTGNNSANTITFDGIDSSMVTLAFNSGATVGIRGATYTTFRNMTIRNTGGSNSYGFQLSNNSSQITIDACHIVLNISGGNFNHVGISASGSLTSSFTEGQNAFWTTVSNCRIDGGEKGIHFEGQNASRNIGNSFINNHIVGAEDYGFYMDDQDSLTIAGNVIEGLLSAFSDGIYCFDIQMFNISGNTVLDVPDWGIYIADGNFAPDGTPTSRGLISNNMVSSITDYGIYVDDIEQTDIWHNSVANSSTFSGAMRINDAVNVDVQNNIFYAEFDFAFESDEVWQGSNNVLNHNLYWTPAGNTNFVDEGPTTYADLLAWQTASPGLNANSREGDPVFVGGLSDLHVKGVPPNDGGNNAVGITVDIDGDTRPGAPGIIVDMGADEFTPPTLDAGIDELTLPILPICPGPQTFEVAFINLGIDTIQTLDIKWTVNGVAQTTVSLSSLNLLPGGNLDTTVVGTFTINSGTSYDIIFYTDNPNGLADQDNANDTLKLLGLETGLAAGTYTINSGMATGGTNYQSFTDAVSDLNNFGICGPVVFNVVAASGPYQEQVIIGPVQGTDPTNTIVFDGGATKEEVWVDATMTNTSQRAVVKLDGADYVTLRNLTINNYSYTTTATTYAVGVHLLNDADFNTIEDCIITVDTSNTAISSNVIGIQMAGQFWTTANPSANNTLIQRNRIIGGYAGISMTYTSTTVQANNNRIFDNVIDGPYFYGIRCYSQNAPLIVGNEITLGTQGTSTTGYAIYLGYSEIFKIIGNRILDPKLYGIYMFRANWNGTGTPIGRAQVVNNMIMGDWRSNTGYGFFVTSNSIDIDFFHNSTSLSTTGNICRSFYTANSTTVTGIDVRNNSFANFHPNGHAIWIGNATAISTMDYNNVYVNGDTASLVYIGGTTYGLGTFQGAGGFNNSAKHGDPGYANNANNLHAKGTQLWDSGNNAAGVADDIDGDLRPGFGTTVVDIGADEFVPPAQEAAIIRVFKPVTGCDRSATSEVAMEFDNVGTAAITSIDVGYSLNGATPVTETITANVPSGTSYSHTFTSTVDLSTPGIYNLDVWVDLTNDSCAVNDSVIGYTVNSLANSVSVYPYFQNFDDALAGWVPDNNNATNGSSPFTLAEGWFNDQDDSGQDWVLRSNPPSSNNGPPGDHTTGSTNFLYVEDNLPGNPVNLMSPCFDLTTITAPEMTFWYHSNSSNANINTLHVDVIFGDSIYVDYITPITNAGNSWQEAEVDLIPFTNGSVLVRFRVNSGTGTFNHDIAIDDVGIRDVPPNDLGAVRVLSPQGGSCGDSTAIVAVEIENFGSDPQSNFPVRVDIDRNGSFYTTLTQTFTSTIQYKSKDTIIFNTPLNTYNGGDFDFTAYTLLTTDQDLSNDTTVRGGVKIVGIPAAPTGFDGTSCDPDSLLLRVLPDSAGAISYWWDAGAGGSNIAQGDTFITPFLATTTQYWVSQSAFSSDTLKTPFDQNNGSSGNMFDLFAKNAIQIDSFDIATSSTATILVEIYHTTLPGTYVGNETNAAAWTLMGSTMVTGAGIATLTRVPVGGFNIPAGATYGIYVATTSIRYTTLPANDTLQNNDMEVRRGIGLGALFGSVFSPRGWNGNIYYSRPGCESPRTQVNAIISAPPTLDLGPDQVTCGTVTLSADPGYTYLWNTGDTTQTLDVSLTGSYSVLVTNPAGCTNRDTINVFTNPNPALNLGPDSTVCGSQLLDAGNPGAAYTWQDGSSSQTFLATASGLYSVTVTDVNTGCSSTDSVSLTINASPLINLGTDRTECDQAVLDAGNAGLPTLWSTTATTQTITVTTSGQYYVDVTDPANGCVGTDTVTLTIAPSPTVDLGNDTTVCDLIILDAGNPNATYAWCDGSTTQTVIASATGNYCVEVTDLNGCTANDTINVTVEGAPTAVFTKVQNSLVVDFTDASSGSNLMYAWDFGDGNSSTMANPTHTFGGVGNYIVCLTVTSDCGMDMTCDTIMATVGIEDELLAKSIMLFPNPTEDKVFISVDELNKDLDVTISDVRGRIIHRQTIGRFEQDSATPIDLTTYAKGVYIVTFKADNHKLVRRIVLE